MAVAEHARVIGGIGRGWLETMTQELSRIKEAGGEEAREHVKKAIDRWVARLVEAGLEAEAIKLDEKKRDMDGVMRNI